MRPEVSVVIPTRNRRELLLRSVASALGQEGVALEVIVVDDGSDDGTAEAVTGLCTRKVRLVRHRTNRGVSAARNAGIAHARAPWVAFLDDDDLWAPTKLAAQLTAVAAPIGGAGGRASRGPEWSCTGCVLIDEADRVIGATGTGGDVMDAARVLVANAVPAGGSGVMVRTDVVRELRGFDERLALYEDWDLWSRLALRGAGAAVDRPLVAYRVWRSTSSREVDLEGAWRAVTGRYAPEASALGVRADIADLHRYRAFRALRSGRGHEAAEAYRLLARGVGGGRSRFAALAAARGGGALLAAFTWRDRRAVPAAVRHEAEAWLAAGPGI
jgi:glycosyltransferase involved in cell wall biosynthesis